MLQDKAAEIEHTKNIIQNAEFFWGWSTPAGKLRAKRRAEIIINEIKNRNYLKVLEIGCGTGVFTEFFCKANLDVCGTDISLDLLKKAKLRCLKSLSLNLIVSDVENLPFYDNSFDAIVGVCVLHHINVVSALKEIRRVVKNDGFILFSEPNMMNPQLMLQKNIKPIKRLRILGETENETAFFKWQIKSDLKKLGFREVIIRPFDFLHPWTPKFAIPFIKKIGYYFENIPILKEIAGSLLIYAVK